MSALVNGVEEGSIAEELEIEPGDILLSIDGREINDILDYTFWSKEELLTVDIKKANGQIWSFEIEKDIDEELGLQFDGIIYDRMKVCRNKCIFCFIDQLPAHMRDSLYIKDDDYRHSFLFGNFITLTNLSEKDWEKIITMKLSPLYVSVHALQPDIRAKMLGNRKSADIRKDLSRLKNAGIEVHTQIVLCPGINDGQILEDTIKGLAEYFPSVASIGIVPVGLTGHRDKLPRLRGVNSTEADDLINLVDHYQQLFREKFAYGLVYLADEFYVKAGKALPPASYYDDFSQIENGIGIGRILLDEFAEEEFELPERIDDREVYLLTGESAFGILETIADRMNLIEGLDLNIIVIKNSYFGGEVTVTGLLTGSDIIAGLGQDYAGKKVIIPEIVCKEGQDTLLDDISLDEIKAATGAEIVLIDGSASSLVKAVLGSK